MSFIVIYVISLVLYCLVDMVLQTRLPSELQGKGEQSQEERSKTCWNMLLVIVALEGFRTLAVLLYSFMDTLDHGIRLSPEGQAVRFDLFVHSAITLSQWAACIRGFASLRNHYLGRSQGA